MTGNTVRNSASCTCGLHLADDAARRGSIVSVRLFVEPLHRVSLLGAFYKFIVLPPYPAIFREKAIGEHLAPSEDGSLHDTFGDVNQADAGLDVRD